MILPCYIVKNNTHNCQESNWHKNFLEWKICMATITGFEVAIPDASYGKRYHANNNPQQKFIVSP
jgi:hypothetical protein